MLNTEGRGARNILDAWQKQELFSLFNVAGTMLNVRFDFRFCFENDFPSQNRRGRRIQVQLATNSSKPATVTLMSS
jgi:hypothetical protein